jgi:hypothetical protein
MLFFEGFIKGNDFPVFGLFFTAMVNPRKLKLSFLQVTVDYHPDC